jgi:chromosome partitioning protein
MARVLVTANGKGGVGKTTITADLGGLYAAAGHRVLAVDLDPQGSLGHDLGYRGGELDDDGRELRNALLDGGTLRPAAAGVREGLDVAPGGQALEDVRGVAFSRTTIGRPMTRALAAALVGVQPRYDLVLIDTPPGERELVETALVAANYLLVPTKTDEASPDGLGVLGARVAAALTHNPDLHFLGIVLFGVQPRSRTLRDQVRAAAAAALGSAAPVLDAEMRHLESAAVDARRHGLLPHELEAAQRAEQRSRLQRLRAGTCGRDQLLSRDASGLAADCSALAGEVLQSMLTVEGAAA